nr:helix-turn-helix domain-containing protein [Actinoplanes ianthinogenes]
MSLLSTRSTWTSRELAERMAITGRTVRRDIARTAPTPPSSRSAATTPTGWPPTSSAWGRRSGSCHRTA